MIMFNMSIIARSEVYMSQFDRREFLKFIGITTYGLSSASILTSLTSCSETSTNFGIAPSFSDELVLAKGLNYYPLISWGESINSSEKFGFNNDYIAIEEIDANKLIMWANHEYVHSLFIGGYDRNIQNVDKEMLEVGGSIFEINKTNARWSVKKDSQYNRRLTAKTKIPFANNTKVMGQDYAIGTLANCAGGKTPWNTFLTCEENYDSFYGERNRKTGEIKTSKYNYDWFKFYNYPPEHYGWVVEIDPYTGSAQKHTNLGRFAHECATCVTTSEKVVVYSGDDKNDEHLYKFISDSKSDLKSGTLYAANIEKGIWLPLDLEKSPELKKHFSSQLDVMIYVREAAKILGATPLDRPEDIERNPLNGDIFVSLTNNKPKGVYHGSILKISEDKGNYESLTFKADTFLVGGQKGGLSCPDNIAFDKNGNLWVCSDISGGSIGKKEYKEFGNNGLFVIPAKGPSAGKVVQIASGPVDSELTGLCFSPDHKTLFLSVQHPGEKSKSLDKLTSTWPTGKIPKPTIVAIHGPLLEELTK